MFHPDPDPTFPAPSTSITIDPGTAASGPQLRASASLTLPYALPSIVAGTVGETALSTREASASVSLTYYPHAGESYACTRRPDPDSDAPILARMLADELLPEAFLRDDAGKLLRGCPTPQWETVYVAARDQLANAMGLAA